jgi:GNAT superfamily N-acetyltransferase
MQALKLDGVLYPVLFQLSSPGRKSLSCYDDNEDRFWRLRIADISWQEFTGEIKHVYTTPELRRRGIATALLQLAKRYEPKIHHSATRTLEADAWVEALERSKA